ncbi:tripartite tricarboxylate transporter substrate binding protein [Pigmentiphaga soli]|uniref:Tripartite tricarboxylate transporter substrate binding protein n=1 Tax=Pigmentiphaga soli TaxID=1007095 RepID=A0ABP8GKF4_9BURK
MNPFFKLCAAAALSMPWLAHAQDGAAWPTHAITILVPSAPGDGADQIARVLAEKLRGSMGETFVVDNKPGAGGIIGSVNAARAKPDGYTFILGNAGSHGINAATYPDLPYDPVADFVPVSLVYEAPNIFVASKKLPVHSLQELIAYARQHPGQLNYGSGGPSSSAHMSTAYLGMLTGIEAVHVPYRGAAQGLAGLTAGQVDFMAVNLPPAAALVKSGQITPLAMTTRKRSPVFPGVPTVEETGIKGYETVAWFGLFAPRGTPDAIVRKLSAQVAQACRDRAVQEKLQALGGEVVCGSPEDFAAYQKREIANWREVAKFAHIQMSATH